MQADVGLPSSAACHNAQFGLPGFVNRIREWQILSAVKKPGLAARYPWPVADMTSERPD